MKFEAWPVEPPGFGSGPCKGSLRFTDAQRGFIGGYDPSNPATDVAANRTNDLGKFSVQVNLGTFPSNGVKTIGIQATDSSGTKGNLATIGRAAAVADIKGIRVTGFVAWATWLTVHLWYLIGFQNRLLVLIRWSVSFATHGRGARLITGASTAGDDRRR